MTAARALRSLASLLILIGSFVISGLGAIGRVAKFAGRTVAAAVRPPYYPSRLLEQMLIIGYFSLPVVGLTAFFTGAALAQQIFTGGSRFNASSTVPAVTVIAIVRELGPVLGGLMVAGRVSSAMAAELGTMRVTEQIDALTTLRTDPYQYLIVPRVMAALIVLPLLVLLSNAIGVLGGYVLSTAKLGFNAASYLRITHQFLEMGDIGMSMIKAAVFGIAIAMMGCYHGFHSNGGAAGVGRATTAAVVSAFILILLSNLIITVMAFGS